MKINQTLCLLLLCLATGGQAQTAGGLDLLSGGLAIDEITLACHT